MSRAIHQKRACTERRRLLAVVRESCLALLDDPHGAIATEYVVLVGVCGLIISIAIAGLGIPLVNSYDKARAHVIAPLP